MESWQRRSPIAVSLIVAYVCVLPLLARLPHGPATGGQYVATGDGILSETFLFQFALLSVFSSLAAPPLVVAWARRDTHIVTCVLSFVLTTFLLVFWHYSVNTLQRNEALLPGLIPIGVAVITSVVALVVGLVEEAVFNRQPRSVRSGNRATRVVAPASRPSNTQMPKGRMRVYGLGLFALVLGLLGWHDRAQAERLRAEAVIRGDWRGSYTSTQFGEGSAQLDFSWEGPIVHGSWMVEPGNNIRGRTFGAQEGGPGASTWAGSGQLTGTSDAVNSRRFAMTLAVTLLPGKAGDCAVEATMTTEIADGKRSDGQPGKVLYMRGPWRTVNCTAATSGQFVLSKPAPYDAYSP
jgi:hypothetical protein